MIDHFNNQIESGNKMKENNIKNCLWLPLKKFDSNSQNFSSQKYSFLKKLFIQNPSKKNYNKQMTKIVFQDRKMMQVNAKGMKDLKFDKFIKVM